MASFRLPTVGLLCVVLTALSGCYNTYQVPSDEFRKLQSATALREDAKLDGKITPDELAKLESRGENDAVTVQSIKGQQVSVTRDTKTFVRSVGGRRYQVTPFNFNMASSQLVASDRDTLIPLSDLASFEVDHFSTGKTVAIISGAAAVAIGFIVVLFQVAGKKSTTDK